MKCPCRWIHYDTYRIYIQPYLVISHTFNYTDVTHTAAFFSVSANEQTNTNQQLALKIRALNPIPFTARKWFWMSKTLLFIRRQKTAFSRSNITYDWNKTTGIMHNVNSVKSLRGRFWKFIREKCKGKSYSRLQNFDENVTLAWPFLQCCMRHIASDNAHKIYIQNYKRYMYIYVYDTHSTFSTCPSPYMPSNVYREQPI